MLGPEYIVARLGATAIGTTSGILAFAQPGGLPDGAGEVSVVAVLVVALTTISYALIRLVEKMIGKRHAKKDPDEDPIQLLRAIRDSLRDPLRPDVGLAATIGANHRKTEREFERLRGRLDRLEMRLFPHTRGGEAGS